ncbi:enoyl reductase [Trichoderma velutinum]
MATNETPFTAPRSQKAVVVDKDDRVFVWDEAPVPALKSGQFYVRTEAVAINPSDTKMRGSFVTPNGILGTDYAGTVVALGPDVKDVVIGDRLCGAQHAMKADTPDRGAFSQYNLSAGDIWLRIPPNMTIEQGASFGAGISTAGLAIRSLGLPLPDTPLEKPQIVLVYGGSTATGTIAMQLLRLANLIPIATCSPKSAELAKSYGAEEVFDYRDKECATKIRTYTKNNLKYALDCITTVESTRVCFNAIGRAGGQYVSLDPFAEHVATRKSVRTDWVLGPAIFGDGSTWPAPYGRESNADIRQFGAKLWRLAQKLVDEGKLRNHPLRVLEGGWDSVIEGLDLVRSGKVSGEKIIVRVS